MCVGPFGCTGLCTACGYWEKKYTLVKESCGVVVTAFRGVVNSGRFGDREGVCLGRYGRENRHPVSSIRVLMVQIFQCYRTVINRSELHEDWFR